MAVATMKAVRTNGGRISRKHAPYAHLLRTKRAELLDHLWDHRQEMVVERVPEDGVGLASLTLLEDLTVGALQREQQLLSEVDAALVRLREGVFGLCERCGEEIPERRLKALPWARLCLDCAERRAALSLNN
ncbi:MAG TPA: TraR/DksA family transcriptional regulator [Candidatus Acidoferrales bacterium]|nr:TraR/DksA family transcriptional regulator [Candidatus Acidoferrales bacterium]